MTLRTLLSAALLAASSLLPATEPASSQPGPAARLDPDMARVLAALASLDPKPIETLSPEEAREQPTMADAMKKVMADEKLTIDPRAGLTVTNTRFADQGSLRMRYYTPEGATKDSNLPAILFFRGGGWVIGSSDAYDASAAALARKAGAVVVSVNYPRGPEQKFPAAHDDAVAAYRYLLKNAKGWGLDASRIAVVGESAGGNLAVNTAIAARDAGLTRPVAVAAIYPVAQTGADTPSMVSDADAKPLNATMMGWFFRNATNGGSDLGDPRLNLVAADLKDLPPVTIVNAAVDPLRSDGELLAGALERAGTPAVRVTYDGVTHEFFGLAPLVAKAGEAQDFVVGRLREGFAKPSAIVPPAPPPDAVPAK